MSRVTELFLPFASSLQAAEAGLFISRGRGRHVDRIAPHFDLIFVREGLLEVYEEERLFRVGAGETLLLWPERHHWGAARYLPGVAFYWIHFTLTQIPLTQTPTEARTDTEARTEMSLPQQMRVSRPQRLEQLFDQYLEDSQRGYFHAAQANTLLQLILLEIAAPHPPEPEMRADPLAVRALSYIHAHFTFPLNASEVARQACCNPDYLARLFRDAYGMTMTQAIHQRRLTAAKRLLVGTDKNIDEIAREVGFADAGYFGRLFKRREGITAFDYRRKHARTYIMTE
jgi:AraC-like DNA-binding protein